MAVHVLVPITHDEMATLFERAVGFYATFTSLTLAERWNGLKWKVTPSESPGTTVNVLSGVSATSRRTAWSVGATSSSSEDQELAEHVC